MTVDVDDCDVLDLSMRFSGRLDALLIFLTVTYYTHSPFFLLAILHPL